MLLSRTAIELRGENPTGISPHYRDGACERFLPFVLPNTFISEML